ncbi:MAG: zinc-binding dehydrogenase [Streptosporangiales bacterium]|nr:zinc-binding dehydrogenase [Streptosporangiales bacterium]
MRQVAQNYRTGELTVLDVPRPSCAAGGVLIRSLYSLISTGTELTKVGEAQLSLLGKARARPDQVRKVVDAVARQGVAETYKKVMTKLDSYTPLGYSLCGVVVDVGRGAEEFSVGQLVAAAGNEYALHAEYNWVPRNLCVAVPDGVLPEHAAFSTVGAIAMHGVRRAEAQLGESACVIGLGLVGQLAVRLLTASGIRVFGLDPVADRCRLAEKAGALLCAAPDAEGVDAVDERIREVTGGIGVDHVFLASGGSSAGPVQTAARLARDRAHVVDIGRCRLDLPWHAYYDKELDVRFSRSYGPGRYDASYEVDGVDYPVGYVRWTQRRNLECFVDLLAREQIDVASLISGVFPVEQAVEVYQRLGAQSVTGVGFLFEYPQAAEPVAAQQTRHITPTGPTRARPARHDTLRLGFLGAGSYASGVLLPALAGTAGVTLAHVATSTALSAVNAQRRFGFAAASSDPAAVLDDDSLDAIFVVTRHSTHADLVCRALRMGKPVFVEKPLALGTEEVERIRDVVTETGNDRLLIGFNRRFSPLFTELRARFGSGGTPGSARYLVSAGELTAGSWYADEQREGSRFAGEGGHFIDTLGWWFDQRPVEVYAVAGPQSADRHVSLRYADGSVGVVDYVTAGSNRFPKETFDAAAGGRSARLDDFRRATGWHGRQRVARRARQRDKGQAEEMRQFLHAVRTGGPMPIGLNELIDTTNATLAVERSVATGNPESV